MLALALAYRELSSEYYVKKRSETFKPFSRERDMGHKNDHNIK